MRRRRPVQITSILLSVTVAAAIVSALQVPPRVMKFFGESKLDIAKMTIRKYADEAYPQWAAAHPARDCPPQLLDLNEYMNNKDTKDVWGNDYRMACVPGRRAIWVYSLGEDGVLGTDDDLWSDQ